MGAESQRAFTWILSDPLPDAGQWDMFVNLLEKYGVVPKSVMPKTHNSSNSQTMNSQLMYLDNVIGGHIIRYLNVDMETMKKAAVDMVADGQADWITNTVR